MELVVRFPWLGAKDFAVTANLKVFLSHSSLDSSLARQLAIDLKSVGVDVWLDQWKLEIGEAFRPSIEHGVDKSDFVIVLLTSASVASSEVSKEWQRKTLEEARVNRVSVVPVRGENCEMPDILAHRSYADISGGSYGLGFRHLLEILRHHSNGAVFEIDTSKSLKRQSSENLLPVVTPITLEVGSDLVPLFKNDDRNNCRFLDELVPRLRENLQEEFGFSFPGIRIVGNEESVSPYSVSVLIDEIPESSFELSREEIVVAETLEGLAHLGIEAKPLSVHHASSQENRIPVAARGAAEAVGLVMWDASEYLIVSLHRVIRNLAVSFLDVDVTCRLAETVQSDRPELLTHLVPDSVSWIELTNVLKCLVAEGVCVGDPGSILSALSDCGPGPHDTNKLAEKARYGLRRQIIRKFSREDDTLPVLLLDPEIEEIVRKAIQPTSIGDYLDLAPNSHDQIRNAVHQRLTTLGPSATGVPILTDVDIRAHMRRIVSFHFPSLHVVSRQEVGADAEILAIDKIRLDHSPNQKTSMRKGAQI